MKTYLSPIFLSIILCANCARKAEDVSEKNVSTAKQMFDAFNRHDWKTMAGYYADSALFLDPSLGQEYVVQNHEQTANKYQGMEQTFPDIRDELVGIYPSGDKVIVEFVSSGTATDGTKFRLPISSILTLQNGKIVRDATYFDQ